MYLGQFDWMDAAGSAAGTFIDPGQLATIGEAFAAGPITGAFTAAIIAGMDILKTIGIRTGANEADAITPTQNRVGAILTQVNAQIPTSTIPVLQQMFAEVVDLGRAWLKFLADPRFTDGRASAQAANTIMPLIDGSCGYQVHNLTPTSLHCGPAGGGEDGTLGSIQRQILALGGNMVIPSITQGAGGNPYPSLQYQTSTTPWIPQSGTLSTVPSPSQSAGSYSLTPGVLGSGMSPTVIIALGIGAFLLFRGRKGS